MNRSLAVLFTCFAAVALVAACGSDDTTVSTGDEPGNAPDDGGATGIGGEYIGRDVTVDGDPYPLVDGTEIHLRVEDGRLSAGAGCNSLSGEYTLDGDTLAIDGLAMTEMGCDEPRHAQDQWLAELLTASPTVETTDQGFVLRRGGTEIVFVDREIADPDRALVGTTWRLDSIIDGTGPDGAVSQAMNDRARLVFDANGFVVGHDGCNEFGYAGEADGEPTDGLAYTVDGDQITFSGAPVTTEIACPDIDTDAFWAVVSGTVTFDIDAARLTLSGDDRGLGFRAE